MTTPQPPYAPPPKIDPGAEYTGLGGMQRQLESDLLSGNRQYKDLSQTEKQAFDQFYSQRQGVFTPGTSYKPEAIDALSQQLSAQYGKNGQKVQLPGWLHPLEWAGSKMYQVYSNYVSRPLSATALYVRSLGALATGEDYQSFGEIWGTAKHMSPGQSLSIMFMTEDQLKENHDFDLSKVASGEANKTWFKKGLAKYTTGATDLAVAWYADPFVLAGRGLGATRRLTYAKPVAGKDVGKLIESPTVNSMLDMVEKVKVGKSVDEATHTLVRTVPSFMTSKNGSGYQLANALVRAEDRAQAKAVLAVSIGDPTAIQTLRNTNVSLDVQLNSLAQKKSSLYARWIASKEAAVQDPAMIAARESELQRTLDQIVGLQETRIKNLAIMENAATVSRLNYNRVTTPLGQAAREGFYGADVSYARAAARGGDPMDYMSASGKIPAAMRLMYNSALIAPLRVARGFTDVKPTSYLDLNKMDSYRSLEANLRDVPGLTRAQRNDMVGRYQNAPVAARPRLIEEIEQEAIHVMAARRGLTPETAKAMYNYSRGMRKKAVEGTLYTTARTGAGKDLNIVDLSANGEVVTRSALLTSQMADSHILLDLKYMDNILKKSGGAIQRLITEQPTMLDNVMNGVKVAGDRAGVMAEAMNSLWKFGQLARIGYGPRAITDELVGQMVATGVFSTMARVGAGMRTVSAGTLEKFFNGSWQHNLQQADELMITQYDGWIENLTKDIDRIEGQAVRKESRAASAPGRNARHNATQAAAALRQSAAERRAELAQMRDERAGVANRGKSSVERQPEVAGRRHYAAYEGSGGQMFRNENSAKVSMENQVGSINGSILRLNRPRGWTAVRADPNNPGAHLNAWTRDLKQQIGNDDLAKLRVSGESVEAMEKWLRTPAGQEYISTAPRQMLAPRERAEEVAAHVDHYLDTVDTPVVRQAILDGTLTAKMLDEASPNVGMRPDVHGENLEMALAKEGPLAEMARTLDGFIGGFYKVMNQLPAEHLSRNPLFAQLYKSHLKDISKTWDKNGGATHLSSKEYEMFSNAARKRALTDVKRLTFNMDYQSRSVHALRFMAPFFGATMESWTRWSRIIAEKPQVAAHAVNLYNAPMRTGIASTYNGDHVGADGYATNSVTGERYKVSKGDIYLNVPIPEGMRDIVSKATGMKSEDLVIPLNSLNLVLQNEPLFSPGLGPVVQIPANEFATGGKLGPMEWEGQYQYADLLKETGILPFGVTANSSDMITPAWARRFFNAEDESSSQYQSAFLGIMQNEYWRYQNGQRDDMPTMKEIRDKSRKFTFFKATVNYVLPFNADFKNPVQFYSDVFKKMQSSGMRDPDKAFLDKYGDSMWMFMAAMSKSNLGLPASNQGAKAQQGFQDLIDTLDDPKLSALLTDQFAGKSFDQGAYVYQLNHPAQTGSDVMAREKISPREALERAEEAKGWYKYNKKMLGLQAELFDRGLTSFSDKGAQDLLARKQAMVSTMSDPEFEGKANPYYNKAWSKAFNTIDPLKMDRRIADMRKIVDNPVAITMANEGMRTDFKSLAMYIDYRDQIVAELAARKAKGGSDNILAKANKDQRKNMTMFTNRLIESDTRFNELHNRYLGRDMGYDETMKEEAVSG